MSDFISTLASKAGINADMAEKGVGALLATLQKNVPAESFSKVSAAIPNATNLLSAFQSSSSVDSGGVSTLTNLAGGLLGGKAEAASSVISQFSKAGFSLDSAKAFIPVVLNLLKDKLSPEIMKQIEGGVPGLSSVLGGGDTGGILGNIKKMF